MYIYKTTNLINGKVYIGKCSKSIHQSENYFGSGFILKTAIKKYGKENFKKEIIDIAYSDDINEKEIYWIAYYRMKNKIYNLTDGGAGGDTFTNSPTKEVRRENQRKFSTGKHYMIGKIQSKKANEKRSIALKGRIPWNKNKKLSTEMIKNIGIASAMRWKNPEYKQKMKDIFTNLSEEVYKKRGEAIKKSEKAQTAYKNPERNKKIQETKIKNRKIKI